MPCEQDQHVIKSGLNRTGSQRYRCQACRRYFTTQPKPEGYDLALRKPALQLYLRRHQFSSYRAGIRHYHQSVSNWVPQPAQALPATAPDQTPSETIELDELYTFVQQKKTGSM